MKSQNPDFSSLNLEIPHALNWESWHTHNQSVNMKDKVGKNCFTGVTFSNGQENSFIRITGGKSLL